MISLVTVNKDNLESFKEQIQLLFLEMYKSMKQSDSELELEEDGEKIWLKGASALLGKINHLVVAKKNDEFVGFGHGFVKPSPAYLNRSKTGFITHVYVSPQFRNQNIARMIVQDLEQNLLKNDLYSIELDVLFYSENSKLFWERLDYKYNLILMRKLIK